MTGCPRYIFTPRLRLVPLSLRFARPLTQIALAEQVRLRPTQGWAQGVATVQKLREYIQGYKDKTKNSNERFWAILKQGQLIGGLHHHKPSLLSCIDISYWLADSAEGQGYMTEALREGILPMAKARGIKQASLLIEPTNVRSQAIAQRLGFSDGTDFGEFTAPDGRSCRLQRHVKQLSTL